MKRIGVFGGIFNPVHTAHLIAAEEVREQMHLDIVLFIPSANPPHKDSGELIESEKRLKMVELAVSGNKNFEASDIEIKNPGKGKSYTVDTLTALREKYKNEQVKFYLIIGMDQLIDLHTWKDPGKLFALSEVVVINRPGFLVQDVKNEFGREVTYVPVPSVDISSSVIRHRIKENKSIKYLVPEKVEKFILENNLYMPAAGRQID
ncbi:MAG: nicotinate-nucleotide adenylyltransferase [Chlorobi bacterium]|nr:nicotinate-nucleotide adenylyltransferase [Chlorobiota bacterium]